jgi:transposase-like protein
MSARSEFSRRRSAAEWRRLLLELAQSGEGEGRFCRRHGVRPATLKWWRWRLACGGLPEAESALAGGSGAAQFTEIRWRGSEAGGCTEAGFELRWGDGLTLRIPSEFDAGALRRLLAVLEAVGC